MRGATLARSIAVAAIVTATAVLGFSILAGISTPSSAREEDEVKTFKLTRGKLQITNFADFRKPAVIRIRDQEFAAGREYTSHYGQFRLSDRDVLIISNDPM
jgi:hypothetical protein